MKDKSAASQGVMVVQSPLQLVSAFELMTIMARPADEIHIIICMDTIDGQSKNLPQMRAILAAFDAPATIHWALWPRSTSRWIPHFRLARGRQLDKAAREIGTVDWLFLGSFKNHYMKLTRAFRPSALVIGDDGTCLLRKTESEAFRRKVEKFVTRAASYGALTAEFFTCFRSENLKLPVIENDFRRLAAMAASSKIVDEVHIIGSAFTSRKEYSERDYWHALQHLVTLAKKTGDRIVYLPHRWETEEQLSRIENLFASSTVEIRRNNMPIELAYATAREAPRAICGFSSTSLVTLPKVLRGKPIRFTACQIDFSTSKMSAEKIAGYRALYGLIEQSIGADAILHFTPPGSERLRSPNASLHVSA